MNKSVWVDTFNMIIECAAADDDDDAINKCDLQQEKISSQENVDFIYCSKEDLLNAILKKAFIFETRYIEYFDYNQILNLLMCITSKESIVLNSISTYWFFAKATKLWEHFAKCKNEQIRQLTQQHLYNNKTFPAIQICESLWITIRNEHFYDQLKSFKFNVLTDKIRQQILLLCKFKDVHLKRFGLNKKLLMQGLYDCNFPKKCPLCKKTFKFNVCSHICSKYRNYECSNLTALSDHKLIHYSECENALCMYLPHSVGRLNMTKVFDTYVCHQTRSKVSNLLANLQNNNIFWIKVKLKPNFNAISKEIIQQLKDCNAKMIYNYCNHILNVNKCNCFLSFLKLTNVIQSQQKVYMAKHCSTNNKLFNFLVKGSAKQQFDIANFLILMFPPIDSVVQYKILKRNMNKIVNIPAFFNTKIIIISQSFEFNNANVKQISFDEI